MAATSADQDHHLNDPIMTSATEETSPTPHGHGRAHGAQERPQRHAGAWVETLRRSDVSRLWTELQRLVVNQPLVRASYSAGLLVEEGDRGSAYIELTNLLTAELRKRHPESYRLARRISTIIQSSANFRRVDAGAGEDEPHRRLVDRVYGLREWRADKSRRAQAELEERVQMIPVRQRDTRMVGCTGDAQIIISNSDLEDLIVSVL